MKSSDESQKSILDWFLTDDPSERKNLAGYKPMLLKRKWRGARGITRKDRYPKATERKWQVWIPGDITFFIFGTDIDLFDSLPHFVVLYCGDEDF